MNREELIARARVLGTLAYQRGQLAVPALDREFMALIPVAEKIDATLPILDAWAWAWARANTLDRLEKHVPFA